MDDHLMRDLVKWANEGLARAPAPREKFAWYGGQVNQDAVKAIAQLNRQARDQAPFSGDEDHTCETSDSASP